MKITINCPLLIIFLIAGIGNAQVKPDSIQLEAMKKLDIMHGKWEGQGWIELSPGSRNNFLTNVTVKKELEGIVLKIDVCFSVKIPDVKNEIIVHKGFDIISYDTDAGLYRVHGYGIDGQFGSGTAQLKNSVFQISMNEVGNEVRHWRSFIDFSKSGVWHDISEQSQNGKDWEQYSEITMKRAESY